MITLKTPSLAALAAGLAAAFLAGCGELPPMKTTQNGYRGTGMVQVQNPELLAYLRAENQAPAVPYEIDYEAAASSPRAGEFYENVQVLRDISTDEFNRLMLAITEWVVPQSVRDAGEGCNYCHNPANLASDEVYTKVVARRMLQMTQSINVDWQSHVQQTGVTCYTCHRGQPVPSGAWHADASAMTANNRFANKNGHNLPVAANVYSSLPRDPFAPYLSAEPANIRVQSGSSMPSSDHIVSIQKTEQSYALMMHMSDALGVNCTFCHNSRAFSSWESSTPQRVTSWYGLRMVSLLNQTYVEPLQPVFAAAQPLTPMPRLGPLGDVLKVNCTTCHQGANKPLLGAPMAASWPELARRTDQVQQAAAVTPPADPAAPQTATP